MAGGAKKPSRKVLVDEFLRARRPDELDPPALAALRAFLRDRLGPAARLSDRYLLELVERAGVPVARSLGGLPLDLCGRVHFHDLAAAESSLLDLGQEYSRARAAGDPQRAADCRRAVLRGKDRLNFLLRRPGLSPEKLAEKEEILQWFLVWLETPELFAGWLALRKRAAPLASGS